MMSFLDSFLLGIVEGITEFLPISSTGHLILSSYFLGLPESSFVKSFEIAIQLGAILAVFSLYFQHLKKYPKLFITLSLAFIPTGIIGLLAYKTIKLYLFSPLTVSIALVVGGIVLLFIDRFTVEKEEKNLEIQNLPISKAVSIGFFQCISMIPGVSRSAATMIGGMSLGLSRVKAAEFSFLLALPTMCAATGYDLLKTGFSFTAHEWTLFAVGFVTAFVFALFSVKWLVKFLTSHGFAVFGWYRIILGTAVFLFLVL
ncbi:MAG: undecaprenyl-diphosphate phosphatase [Candidatus Peregrinibacteria bacterium]